MGRDRAVAVVRGDVRREPRRAPCAGPPNRRLARGVRRRPSRSTSEPATRPEPWRSCRSTAPRPCCTTASSAMPSTRRATPCSSSNPPGTGSCSGDAQLMYARARCSPAAGIDSPPARPTSPPRSMSIHRTRTHGPSGSGDLDRGRARAGATVSIAASRPLARRQRSPTQMRSDGWVQLASTLQAMAVRAARRLGLVAPRRGRHLPAAARRVRDRPRRRSSPAGTPRRWRGPPTATPPAGIEACRSGLGLLDDIVAEAPTLEQRSAAMRLGRDLSQLAIELAVELRDADTVLAAAEGTRARSLHEETGRPAAPSPAHRVRAHSSCARSSRRDSVTGSWSSGSRSATRSGRSCSAPPAAGSCGSARPATCCERVIGCSCGSTARRRNPTHPAAMPFERSGCSTTCCSHRSICRRGSELVVIPVGGLHGIPWAGLPSLAGRTR